MHGALQSAGAKSKVQCWAPPYECVASRLLVAVVSKPSATSSEHCLQGLSRVFPNMETESTKKFVYRFGQALCESSTLK